MSFADEAIREFIHECQEMLALSRRALKDLQAQPTPEALHSMIQSLQTIERSSQIFGLLAFECSAQAMLSLSDGIALAPDRPMDKPLAALLREGLDLLEEMVEHLHKFKTEGEWTAAIGKLAQQSPKAYIQKELLSTTSSHTQSQPLSSIFAKFPRLINDLSQELGKQIVLEVRSLDLELSPLASETLKNALLHILRNAADHGIEFPPDRMARQKPGHGTISIQASTEAEQLLITVQDDGRGLNPQKIRDKALQKGLISADQATDFTDIDIEQMIFASGFSTKEAVSKLSGRGIGLDIVKTSLAAILGSVEVTSKLHQGTCFVLRLPLNAAQSLDQPA